MKVVKQNLMVSLGLLSCLSGSAVLAMESQIVTLKSLASARLSAAVHGAVMENQDTRSVGIKALEDGADPNAIAPGAESIGCTILHQACLGIYDRPDAISALIGAGATVDSTMNNGETPLLSALSVENFEAAHTLIEHGADVNVQSEFYNHTPILYAARHGRCDLIAPLLAEGADLRYRDAQGNNALMLAADYGHIEAFKELKRLMKSTDDEVVEALSYKARRGDKECILGCFDNNMSTALHWAVKNRCDLLARKLCEDSDDRPLLEGALSVAAQCGNDTVARMLCQRGDLNLDAMGSVGENRTQRSPLVIAVCEGHEEVVKILCIYGAEINNRIMNDNNFGHTALSVAAYVGHAGVIRILCRHGADVHMMIDPIDEEMEGAVVGTTALSFAARNNHPDAVRALCEEGAERWAPVVLRGIHYTRGMTETHREVCEILKSNISVIKRPFVDHPYLPMVVGGVIAVSGIGIAEYVAYEWLMKKHPVATLACMSGMGSLFLDVSVRHRWWEQHYPRFTRSVFIGGALVGAGITAGYWGKCLLSAKNAAVSSFAGAASVVKWLRR